MQQVDPHASQPSSIGARQRLGLHLVSALLVLIGLAALVWFVSSVANDANIRAVRDWAPSEAELERPSLVLAFLDSFGIVVPVLLIGIGLLLMRLGVWLHSQDINAVRWSVMALRWMTIGVIAVAALNFATNGANAEALRSAGPIALAAIPLAAGMLWLNHAPDSDWLGQETLGARQTRTAWNLVMPALIVLIVVAARPLEQTFITSLTDKRFASSTVPRYVGLDNYRQLLSLRVDKVECRRDESTGECRRNDNGTVRWQTISRGLLEQGYRTPWNVLPPLVQGADTSLAISGRDQDWLRSMWTTLKFTVVSVSLELMVALFMALTVNSGFRGRGLMRAVMLVPWAIPTVISARLWQLILKDTSAGILNRVLIDIGVLSRPEAWLVEPSLQLPSAILVDVWKTSPFMGLLLLAGLQTIPLDLYEAAAVDGASRVRQLFSITLPLLRPTIGVALVFRTLDALRVFDLFNVLFGRRQVSMATYNYEVLVNNQAAGYASAIGVLIFLFIAVFAVIYVRLLKVQTE